MEKLQDSKNRIGLTRKELERRRYVKRFLRPYKKFWGPMLSESFKKIEKGMW